MSLIHPLPLHRAHDVAALIAVWKEVSAAAGLRETVLGQAAGWPVVALRNDVAGVPRYLSAGVHGDEAAAAWGLAEWASGNLDLLRRLPFALCPCLNPAGLAANTRADHRGIDLNRRFHDQSDPLIASWQQWMAEVRPRLGICLHEDYDAQGCYVYELSAAKDEPYCEPVMRAVELVIPRDPGDEIEGRYVRSGIIQRDDPPADVIGPEAIVLRGFGAATTLTFETPSEFALDVRVLAQRTFVEAALEHL